jgi:hypothetical protein
MGKHAAENTPQLPADEGNWERDMDSVLASIDTHTGGATNSDTNPQDATPPVNANGSAPKKTAPPLELEAETAIGTDTATAYEVDLGDTRSHSDETVANLGEEDDTGDLSNDTASVVDTYFDDDEEFLAGDDKVLTEEQDMALFKQSGKVVKWRVENLYRPNGDFRRGNLVRANPPVLIISDSDGNEVEFMVTREFAASMRSVMGDAEIAHMSSTLPPWATPTKRPGVANTSTWKERCAEWAKEHKVKATGLILLAIYMLASMVSPFIMRYFGS